MDLHPRGIRTVALGVFVLLCACDTKDASIGSMDPVQGNRAGSTNTDSMTGDAGSESVSGGTGPQSSGGIAGFDRAGASGRGTATGGGGVGAGAGARARGGASAGAGRDAVSGSGGDAGSGLDVAAPRPLLAISSAHGCVIVNGQVYCWGADLSGETGAPGSDVMMPLVTLTGLENEMIGVAVGEGHSCALGKSGKVYCWGGNGYGQLGRESQPTSMGGFCVSGSCDYAPRAVPDLDNAVEVTATRNRTCARLADGTLRCWGDFTADGLSDWVASVTNATSVAVAQAGVCVTTTAGSLSCSFDVPEEMLALRGVRRVVLSSLATDFESDGFGGFGCVLGDGGSVTCFGENTHGERGAGVTGGSAELRPALTAGITNLALGFDHSCALDGDGFLQCWGVNSTGAVAGFPLTSPNCESETCESSPRRVLGLSRVVAVSAAGQTCALAADRTVWCWGTTAYAYAAGAPIRVIGPWEIGGEACVTSLESLGSAREFEFESGCANDSECTAFPLDLSCDHTCALAGIGRNHLPSAEEAMARYEAESCAPAAAASCAAPAVSCPPLTERAVCDRGRCTFHAPERTGCTDRCYCDSERFGALLSQQLTGCGGFDLQPNDIACDVCDGGGADVVVGNTGTADFDGDAVISFEPYEGVSTPPLPAAKTVTLHLAPGERSAPIHFDSDTTAGAKVRVTAAGDCYPQNDGVFNVTFLGPAQVCQ
jgi:hypothetical protein